MIITVKQLALMQVNTGQLNMIVNKKAMKANRFLKGAWRFIACFFVMGKMRFFTF